MKSNRNVTQSKAGNRRVKLAPMTRAVRAVLAASTLTLALGATSGTASAAAHRVPQAHVLQLQRAAIDFAPVADLTLVADRGPAATRGTGPTLAPSAIYDNDPGDIVIDNTLPQNEYAPGGLVYDIFGYSTGGDVDITNSAYIYAGTNTGTAAGVLAVAYDSASVDNSGDVVAYAYNGRAWGLYANGYNGDATITNSGTVYAYGWVLARGLDARSTYGDAVVDNSGSVEVVGGSGNAIGIYGRSIYGDFVVTNSGDVSASSIFGDASAVYGFTFYGDASLTNTGSLEGYSVFGVANGAFVQSRLGGDASITNSGDVTATSVLNSAYGLVAIANGGNASIDNSGTVTVEAYGAGVGLGAVAYYDATVTNSGTVDVYAYAGPAKGIHAYSLAGNATVTNSGDVTATSTYAAATGIYAYSRYYDVSVDNSGSATAVSGADTAVGIYAYSYYGDVTVTNSGDVTATSYGGPGYVGDGIWAAGTNVTVTNTDTGTITAYGYWSAGIEAEGYGDTTVSNAGSIDVAGVYAAYGIYATSVGVNGYANTVDNAGSIGVVGGAYAYGIFASSTGTYGTADVTNSGSIDVLAYGYGATGIDVYAYSDASVTNSGDITVALDQVAGYYTDYAYGINVSSTLGAVTVDNSGTIGVTSTSYATGVKAASYGDVAVTNSGDISATVTDYNKYSATGIDAMSTGGDVTVDNSGTITTSSLTFDGVYYYGWNATGISAQALGDVTVSNSGAIDSTAYKYAMGISAISNAGDVNISNDGSIVATSYKYATGIEATAGGAAPYGNAYVHNGATGTIDVTAGSSTGIGIRVTAYYGDGTIVNDGAINVTSNSTAYGINPRSIYGDAIATNNGSIDVDAGYYALGVTAISVYGDAVAENTGTVDASNIDAYSIGAIGLYARGYTSATASNSGDVTASGYYVGTGIQVRALYGDATVNTSAGSTTTGIATALYYASAIGIDAAAAQGAVTVNNDGETYAYAPAGTAIGVRMSSYGPATLNNGADGYIHAFGATDYAVLGGAQMDFIYNDGLIAGNISLGDEDDSIVNNAGGVLALGNMDVIDLGGFVLGNTFQNDGTITVDGVGSIDMGYDAVTMTNNPFPLVNDGLIDFTGDGQADDLLYVVGDLAGTGEINIDAVQPYAGYAGYADNLFVTGDMDPLSVQTVNVNLAPHFPQTAHFEIPFAYVSGDSAAGNFAPGILLNYNYPLNFIDVGLTIDSDIDATNVTDDVFSIVLDVNGLNDTGTLAATAASSAANFMNAQIGTFRSRLGVNPYGDEGKVLSAFARFYTSSGKVHPGHFATNFGQGGNFNYDQSIWGREIGVNANLWSHLHAGLVLGNADSRQRLIDGGVGTTRMDGTTVGAYVTWYAPGSWYVDLTTRKMAADVFLTSTGGTLQSRLHTNATSLEAGYEFKVGNINIVPQAQYTWTNVHGIQPFVGQYVNFNAFGGDFNRARIGVDFNTQIESGDFRWTPYGSLNWVRNFRGDSSYNVGNIFYGDTWTSGSQFVAELGIGVERGGFGFTLGGTWGSSGGTFDSTSGGQATIRYSW